MPKKAAAVTTPPHPPVQAITDDEEKVTCFVALKSPSWAYPTVAFEVAYIGSGERVAVTTFEDDYDGRPVRQLVTFSRAEATALHVALNRLTRQPEDPPE
jgi:hypothetical protein